MGPSGVERVSNTAELWSFDDARKVALTPPAESEQHRGVHPRTETVVVVGQGYVGLPLAMRAVDAGYEVIGYDVDGGRIAALEDGHSYIEDVPPSALVRALETGRYLPTTKTGELERFDVALITVPTPLKEGRPDVSYIERAAHELGPHLRPGCAVVLESTSYPGTTEEVLAPLLEEESGLRAGADFSVGYSPERIDPGNHRFKIENTPKVVSGIDARSLQCIQEFYQSLVSDVVPVSSPKVAELAKLLENTFRHVNVALVNELAMFAAELGVDVWEAIEAAATKPFGFMKFAPGPGVGGHCLPIDPSYLSWHVRTTLGRSFRFVELANDVNDHMPEYVVGRLLLALNQQKLAVKGSAILVIGLAYKSGTADLRESPALAVAHRLAALGADLAYLDNHVTPDAVARAGLGTAKRLDRVTESAMRAFDAVVVLTDHDDVDYGAVGRLARYVFDTRHRCTGSSVEYL